MQRVELTPHERIDITNAPLPHNKVGNRLSQFRASFVCEPVEGGTRVTRTVEMTFPKFMRWLVEPLLAHMLSEAVHRELAQAKDHLEQNSGNA